MEVKKKQKAKGKKIGRSKKKCEVYRMLFRREKNKVRKLKRHLKLHPEDKQAEKALAL